MSKGDPMSNGELVEKFLEGGHEILLVVSVAPDGVTLQTGVQPVLRRVSDEGFATVVETVVKSLERLRESPMDDLGRVGEW